MHPTRRLPGTAPPVPPARRFRYPARERARLPGATLLREGRCFERLTERLATAPNRDSFPRLPPCQASPGGPPGCGDVARADGGGLGACRAHRPGAPGPAHLHPDAAWQPVLAAGLQAARRVRADRPGLRLRGPLHPRPCAHENPDRSGRGGDDGAGAGPHPGRTAAMPIGACARWSAPCPGATPAEARRPDGLVSESFAPRHYGRKPG